MYKPSGNIVLDKSFDFACRIVGFAKQLRGLNEFELSKQIIRSGTSVGANIREAQRGVSTKDFKNKLGIALKEADETLYWIDVISASLDLDLNELRLKCEELIRLLVAIIKNS